MPIAKGSGYPLLARRGGIEPPRVRNAPFDGHCFHFASDAAYMQFPLRLSHATGNYGPKIRSPYSVRSDRS